MCSSGIYLRKNLVLPAGRAIVVGCICEKVHSDDLIATLVQQCHQSQFTVQRIIVTVGDNEALLFEALNVNDEIQKVLSKYEEMNKSSGIPREPEPAMISIAVEPDESPRLGKEEALIRKPPSSHGGATKKAGGTSEVGHDTKKQQSSPKDDLISF
ncbi:unnamed protein product [Ilex paraguariensis]|uniref:GAT domain-containing protein n=1 Tax=Ilex paraguariensis TaxID=185542 RepID=A0ABC8R093_9AQUA